MKAPLDDALGSVRSRRAFVIVAALALAASGACNRPSGRGGESQAESQTGPTPRGGEITEPAEGGGEAGGAEAPPTSAFRKSGEPKGSAPGTNGEPQRGMPPGAAGTSPPTGQPGGSPSVSGDPVLTKTTDRYEWRVHVDRSPKDETCIHFLLKTETGRSGSGACHHRLPLGLSASRRGDLRFIWGIVSAKAASVRVEHGGGSVETLHPATATERGFVEAFFAGEISQVPVTRVVALDASGRVVAESRDVQNINSI